ncbi:MAG: FAD-dependent oxidoreductase, partial [Simkaniaceae bacterium]|nr:FAD-dependent oxidoreductase [Simkaniaceae bacterium]
HLNMPLIAVAKAPDGTYELTFQNGQKVKADILVLAIPCSIYKDIDFEKNLIPEERLESIKNVQYGTNAKLLVPFAKPPLQKARLINKRAVGFWSHSDVFTLYYTGDTGKISSETILETYEQDRPMLEMAFGDLCPTHCVPMIAQDESSISYDGPVCHSWPNDPYAKGSYSFIAPQQETLLTAIQEEGSEKVKTLFAPIEKTLYFAGEHTTILMEVLGTMEAACESGERVARMIKQNLNSSFCKK